MVPPLTFLLASVQRQDMSMLSLARSDLRNNRPLTQELAYFIEYYDPIRQSLREPEGAAAATMAQTGAGQVVAGQTGPQVQEMKAYVGDGSWIRGGWLLDERDGS